MGKSKHAFYGRKGDVSCIWGTRAGCIRGGRGEA